MFLCTVCTVLAELRQSEARRLKRLHVELDGNSSLRIVYDLYNPQALAWASFKDATLQEGWAYLHIETNPNFPDELTAYAAGVLEAEATRSLISKQIQNRYSKYCSNLQRVTCKRIGRYLQKQVNYMYRRALSGRKKSAFWNQIYLLLKQFTGLNDHFNGAVLQSGNRFNASEPLTMMIINWEGDLLGIEQVLPMIWPVRDGITKKSSRINTKRGSRIPGLYVRDSRSETGNSSYLSLPPGHCSALIKYVDDNIYIGHTSWFDYDSMIRIEKKYDFAFRLRDDASPSMVPGRRLVMTSYPGCLYSLDEFYLIGSGLFVMETTLDVFDQWILRRCRVKSVPTWMRSMAANRLSASGEEWVRHFSQENSGTYNNQYMIVDFNKFETNGRTVADDVLWVVEQMPGTFVSRDLSSVLRGKGFFASFNVPYFEEIRKINRLQDFEAFTTFYKYETNPRKLIFDRDQDGVESVSSMMNLMRYNDYKNDNLSTCGECKPPTRVATFAIAARADLIDLEKHPIYIFKGLSGATDAKAIDFNGFKRQRIALVNGPPNENVPTFSWNDTGLPTPAGHPDKFDFPIVIHDFEESLHDRAPDESQTRCGGDVMIDDEVDEKIINNNTSRMQV
ncbi:putative phospholipase B-like 2 [Galendromus occidentalis]|uniref:Phospholipase B-like n=1 Tax=Galendromus occidentalis TaxID=34638 RepID=A0AAJ7L5R0_9ACAR|nr:putative phospholipase B-like 2 [Galendromus occidentalis]